MITELKVKFTKKEMNDWIQKLIEQKYPDFKIDPNSSQSSVTYSDVTFTLIPRIKVEEKQCLCANYDYTPFGDSHDYRCPLYKETIITCTCGDENDDNVACKVHINHPIKSNFVVNKNA